MSVTVLMSQCESSVPDSLTRHGPGALLVDDPIYLSVYSPDPIRDSKRSLSVTPLYQTDFTDSSCSCVPASKCPEELVVRQGSCNWLLVPPDNTYFCFLSLSSPKIDIRTILSNKIFLLIFLFNQDQPRLRLG